MSFIEFPKTWERQKRGELEEQKKYYEEFVVSPHSSEYRSIEISFLQTLNAPNTEILEVSNYEYRYNN